MKKVLGLGMGLALLCFGCAQFMKMAPAFVGQYLSISIDPGVAFPPEVTMEGFDDSTTGKLGGSLAAVFQTATGESVKHRAGTLIAAHVEPYTAALTKAFHDELLRKGLYKGVVDANGDVRLRLSVVRYGLIALNGSSLMKPILEVNHGTS